MLLGHLLQQTRQRFPDKTALCFQGRSWSYTELDDATDRMAVALGAAGVRAGDRVALFLPNCPELLLAYFAAFKIGAVCVPLNYRYRAEEARFAIEHSGATTLLAHPALLADAAAVPLDEIGVSRRYLAGGGPCPPPFVPFAALCAASASAAPEPTFDEHQPAAILYTSGTTARPKGVVYTHATLGHNCEIQTRSFAFTPADVHLVSTAACHAAAFTGQWLPSVFNGSTCVLTHLPPPAEVVRAIETYGVTRVQMLPASLEDLVEHLEQRPGADLGSWRCCTAGGDAVPLELHHRFRQATGFDLTELFGMTEALSCITNPPFGAKRPGSIGQPTARTRVRLVDGQGRDVPVGEVGEILIQSPAMTVGYWNDPEATAAAIRDGWLYSGDLARQDADGWFWFVGRKKEIIIRGGSNISPLEVEEVLDAHPAVHLSCVVGLPDPHYGQVVVAYVALRRGAAPLPTPEELRQFVLARVAAYKVPERIAIVDELPLGSTGKVDRKQMHARVLAERADRA